MTEIYRSLIIEGKGGIKMHPFNAGRTPESGITRDTIQTTFNVKNGCLNVYSIPNLITLQSIQSIIAEIQYLFKHHTSAISFFRQTIRSSLANQKQSYNQAIQTNSFQIDQT